VGQDECIFKQYLFPKKGWSTNGRIRILPKTDGDGAMFSVFVSDVTGFGAAERTQDELDAFNKWRSERVEARGA
jgi:hypothetical protein